MNIAIVGTSHLTELECMEVDKFIETTIRRLDRDRDTVITGDALGVDTEVRLYTPQDMLVVVPSKLKTTYSFKERNQKIARLADYVYSITTKTKDQDCYHCNKDHQRTGGCWTLKMALELDDKNGEVVVI